MDEHTNLTVRDLRATFEPMGLGPNGFASAEQCAADWDSCGPRELLVREVADASEWLGQCGRTKTVNQTTSSYGLKHEAEDFIGRYICNGALLMAAVRLGFKVQRCDEGYHSRSPNAWINIAKQRPLRWPGELLGPTQATPILRIDLSHTRQIALRRRDEGGWWLYTGTKVFTVSDDTLFNPARLDRECHLRLSATQRTLWLRQLTETLRAHGVAIYLTKMWRPVGVAA